MVEAFSLRGLGRLAESWKQDPPFPGDNEFGAAIADYRQNVVQRYTELAAEREFINDPAAWFANHRSEIDAPGHPFAPAASLSVLAEYERASSCVEALGALNRWPGRSTSVAKLVGNIRQHPPQDLIAAPSLEAPMYGLIIRKALWQHVPLRTRVENPQDRLKHPTRRNRFSTRSTIGNLFLRPRCASSPARLGHRMSGWKARPESRREQ